MRDILDGVADGRLDPAEAEAQIRGYTTTSAGRFDATRETRSGVPEAILASKKTTDEIHALAGTSLETTDRAIVTRLDESASEELRNRLEEEFPNATVAYHDRARTLVVHTAEFEPRQLEASVGVVTGGTSDAMPAGEATVLLREMGASVDRIDDIGVASLARLLDVLDSLREHDVLVVAAGREGALPTVVAGLVDVPVIALPVSAGYGHGGDGEAALSGLLQSCTALTVVNIDAGFTAGVQAGLIARSLDRARAENET